MRAISSATRKLAFIAALFLVVALLNTSYCVHNLSFNYCTICCFSWRLTLAYLAPCSVSKCRRRLNNRHCLITQKTAFLLLEAQTYIRLPIFLETAFHLHQFFSSFWDNCLYLLILKMALKHCYLVVGCHHFTGNMIGIMSYYYTGLLNAVERSVHLHGPFTTSGGELYLIIHRC